MILTNHAITGALLATLTPNQPLLGFTAGFLSHFVLDAIPHWDYSLASFKKDDKNPMNDDMVINRSFVKDIFKISLDGIIGLSFACLILCFYMKFPIFTILSGAIGAMIPDALQFAYMKCRIEPLTSLQRFHVWIHADKE